MAAAMVGTSLRSALSVEPTSRASRGVEPLQDDDGLVVRGLRASAKAAQRRLELEAEALGGAGIEAPHEAQEPVAAELVSGRVRGFGDAVRVQHDEISVPWLDDAPLVRRAGEQPERDSDRPTL